MRLFGAQPLRNDIGIVKCKECDKPVLRSFMAEHAGRSATGDHPPLTLISGLPDNCHKILAVTKKSAKGKGSVEAEGAYSSLSPLPDPRQNAQMRL
jgi:SAGA-associated factor 73